MAEDHRLWAVDAPIAHHPSLARKQTWINTGGQTGIVGPLSLQVVPLDTPAGAVRVLPGGFVAAATPGGRAGYISAPRESYAGDIAQSRTVNIRATGSSGSRTDVVGIIITDPQFEGTAAQMTQAQWEDHRFWDFHVIENAPAAATRAVHFGLPRPFIPLARITLPANRGDVRRENITDLRYAAVRRTDLQTVSYAAQERRVLTEGAHTLGMGAGYTVPEWATRVKASGWLSGAIIAEPTERPGGTGRSIWGNAEPRLIFGSLASPVATVTLQRIRFSWRNVNRFTYVSIPMTGEWVIRDPALRGEPMFLGVRIEIEKTPDALIIDEGTTRFDTEAFFSEDPI